LGLKEEILSSIKENHKISTGELCEKFKSEDEVDIIVALKELESEGHIKCIK